MPVSKYKRANLRNFTFAKQVVMRLPMHLAAWSPQVIQIRFIRLPVAFALRSENWRYLLRPMIADGAVSAP